MSLNSTPSASRVRIGIFGRRNAGKSTLINALTGQDLAVVSSVAGTTTDPVSKSMELLPLGPVVITDTPGIDDEGELGALRVKKSRRELNKTDIAVLAADAPSGLTPADLELLKHIEEKKIPCVIAVTKSELGGAPLPEVPFPVIRVSAHTGENIGALKERIAAFRHDEPEGKRLAGDLAGRGETVVLVTPIDSAAPKGRLILPQQQTIRDLLESGCVCLTVRETELSEALSALREKPKLVITDSQAFGRVSKETPDDVLLTSFSILFARFKGSLRQAVRGAAAIESIENGDRILISEGCTHHRQCGDIGTVKLPNLIRSFTGKTPHFEWTSGTEFPEDLSGFRLIIHCGGCMLGEREMQYRLGCAADAGIPMTNYGIMIAYMHGILKRSLECFPDIYAELA